MKIYSDLKYWYLSSLWRSRSDFSTSKRCSDEEKGTRNIAAQDKYQAWIKSHATAKNRWRTVPNLHELVRTLMRSTEGEGGRTYQGYWMAEAREQNLDQVRLMQRPMVMQRRGSMAAAGLESSASRGRRWRWRGRGGKVKRTPGPIYKVNG